MPAILDVAIGTVFIFLLFSLVVSALNEVILSKFDQRAKFLHMGLQELFGEATAKANRHWRTSWKAKLSGGLLSTAELKGMTKKLCEHGLINALSRTDKPGAESPSYIPAGSFVSALLSILSEPGSAAAALAAGDESLNPEQKSWWDRFLLAAGQHLQGLAAPHVPPKIDATAQLATITTALQHAVAGLPGGYEVFRKQVSAKLDRAATDVTELTAIASELRNELLAPGGLEHTAANIEQWIAALPDDTKLKESLQSLFLVAGRDAKKFTIAVEGWFNATMDRVSGWYKRFAQKWMIVLGFILAAVLNVDTIHIVRELSTTPNLAKAVASQAERYSRTGERPMSEREARDAARADTARAQGALDAANKTGDAEAIATATKTLAAAEAAEDADAKFHAAINRLSETGIPMGWNDAQLNALGIKRGVPLAKVLAVPFQWKQLPDRWGRFTSWLWSHFGTLAALIVGWALTAVAASLGAPFWFDTLNRFVNLRNAGRPPGETDPTAKSTKPPPATMDKTPTAGAAVAR
jgi:hypothetical protein